MLGAILGDIVGSPFEGGTCKDASANLLTAGCTFTDDTVLTVAVAESLIENLDVSQALRKWTRHYPDRGYGGTYLEWALKDNAKPIQSYSNGGAMRVSPVALVAATLDEAVELATKTALPTHGHVEGLRGTQAIAATIWLAKTGEPVEAIRTHIVNQFGYNLTQTVAQRAQTFGFSTLAEDTVPDALTAALEAGSFEQALRNALYIGGDSDTIACMAGAIAEARFGVPEKYQSFVTALVPTEMQTVLRRLYSVANASYPLQGFPTHEESHNTLLGKSRSILRRLLRTKATAR